eukprot:3416181-Alexandrium_andersonii.AAC.1
MCIRDRVSNSATARARRHLLMEPGWPTSDAIGPTIVVGHAPADPAAAHVLCPELLRADGTRACLEDL